MSNTDNLFKSPPLDPVLRMQSIRKSFKRNATVQKSEKPAGKTVPTDPSRPRRPPDLHWPRLQLWVIRHQPEAWEHAAVPIRPLLCQARCVLWHHFTSWANSEQVGVDLRAGRRRRGGDISVWGRRKDEGTWKECKGCSCAFSVSERLKSYFTSWQQWVLLRNVIFLN